MFSYNITSGAFNDLHDFRSVTQDGIQPEGTLLQATDGNLYGMTTTGGSITDGIVFSYGITDSSYNFLSFTGFNGYLPYYGAFVEVGNYTIPVLNHSPVAVTTCANDSALFSATATGTGLAEQWQVSTDNGTTFNNIAGAVDTGYTLLATAGQNGYLYRAIISNPAGADTTATAALQVTSVSNVATVSAAVCTASQTGATYQWIDCNAGQPISGATSQTYTAPVNGNYKCIVTLSGCTDSTNCVSVTSIGIANVPAYSFSLYPNPFANQLNITLAQQNIQQATFKITNVLGQVIYNRQETNPGHTFNQTLDLNYLPSGVYVFEVIVNGQREVKQLVKQ